ncbi:MAG: YjhG/YagF family D-xylonate dehydratase [Fidelibacterota bacterium]|nr:MAG: YjhG/YagF family D-xylonate dehydratase [Candidatus Neomarinimicrobiota bacterium]
MQTPPSLIDILGSEEYISTMRTSAEGPPGKLPLTREMLLTEPSGNLFGLTQNAGMGWNPDDTNLDQYLIISTQGGLRAQDGEPVALGYHTGHWEIGQLVEQAAVTIKQQGVIPFAAFCSDPCDGRTQGTAGMFDSLPYRNDAAITLRRMIRSLPQRKGVMGVAACDKGLPAMMMALAGSKNLPGIIVPGGVMLPAIDAEDTAIIQSLGARFAHQLIDEEYAARMGCRACGSPGGACHFLGTAATSQVVAEALGMALPHSALSPSGEKVWLDMAHRSALALLNLSAKSISLGQILTPQALENAMLVYAAFGGSTNLLLHIPAIAHAAGLPLPTVDDWTRINRLVPRLVDALPNGPRSFPTVQVFAAGGVPEVMLHLRVMGLLNTAVITASGESLDENLDWWRESERRRSAQARLSDTNGVDFRHVIMDVDAAHEAGLTSTVVFPVGNIAPHGSVIKATAIDPSLIEEDKVYRHTAEARVFVSEKDAIRAIKGQGDDPIRPGHIIVLIGCGPLGTGMEETYQLTSALAYIPWGKNVPVLTDARFSGVSTGACIGHIGPEALAGGAVGKLRDGDLIEIIVDQQALTGSINFIGEGEQRYSADEAIRVLNARESHPALKANENLPADTRLWAALQNASGGTWSGCIYDVEKLVEILGAGGTPP